MCNAGLCWRRHGIVVLQITSTLTNMWLGDLSVRQTPPSILKSRERFAALRVVLVIDPYFPFSNGLPRDTRLKTDTARPFVAPPLKKNKVQCIVRFLIAPMT